MNWDRGAGVLPTTHRHMSAEEYYELPEGPPYFQLIHGELFMSPSPNFFHQRIVVRFIAAIEIYLQQHPIGVVIVAPADVQLDDDNVFQPDVYFIRKERMEIVDKHGVKGAPDLVIEVISGSTGRLDLGPKKALYAAKGVVEFWAVFPQTHHIEIFLLGDSAETPARRLSKTDLLKTALLPGLEISLAPLFAE